MLLDEQEEEEEDEEVEERGKEDDKGRRRIDSGWETMPVGFRRFGRSSRAALERNVTSLVCGGGLI